MTEAQKRAKAKYREKHREEIRAKKREYNKKWRKEHREEWNAYMRERRKVWRKGE